MKKIYGELSRIQQELKAPKNLYNSFGKYKYRNAEGILEAVKPLLNGLVLLLSDTIKQVGDRYYVEATATLTDGDDSISVCASAREDETKKGMDGCQITGSCSSYARKYALNGLFDIDDTKDSDDDSLSPKNPANKDDPNDHSVDDKEIGGVTVQKKIPGIANLMRNEISDIQEKLNLQTYEEARKKVFAWGDELKKSGSVESFEWVSITEEQAKSLFAAIKKTYLGDAA